MMLVGAPLELPQINCKLRQIRQTAPKIDANKPSSRKACFSFAAYAKNVITHMSKCHIPIAEGLSDEEFSHIETTFGFTFPPDLSSILQEGLPIGEGFPQWRMASHAEIRNLLNLPITALCREVRCGRFWPSQWGDRPSHMLDAVQVAARELERVPTLVPVYANCYISCFPVLAGNPVFLVQESTILYCGYDLADFFKRQAFVPRHTVLFRNLSIYELHSSGLSIIKDQINMQRSSEAGANDGNRAKDAIKMESSKPKWRWADESPRMPIDLSSYVLAYVNYHFQHVKGDASSSLTPSPPPPTPSPSPSLSSLSSSSSSSKRNSHSDESSSSSLSSSSSRGGPPLQSDPKVGNAMKKYLYFHEKPLPSRMLNKFTMAAPPWAATQARKIDFWSDVAENYCLQPLTSYPATPHTPPKLHETLDNSDNHQPTKQCSYNPSLQKAHSDQLDYTIYNINPHVDNIAKTCSDSPLLKQKCSDYLALQHDYVIDYVDKCSEGPGLEHMGTDLHDYVIHNQPAKRCRGNHPYSSAAIHQPPSKDHHGGNQHPVRQCNNHVEEKASDHPGKMMAHLFDGNRRRQSDCTWLSAYLDGLADALRKGQWGESDINDMLLQSPASSCIHPYTDVDATRLQLHLHQAGWSYQETVQML